MLLQPAETERLPDKIKLLLFNCSFKNGSSTIVKNASAWLHMIVHASCLHTNQQRCLLSALILVNTDVYVRKGSDRCMIELLKRRHSQRLASLSC